EFVTITVILVRWSGLARIFFKMGSRWVPCGWLNFSAAAETWEGSAGASAGSPWLHTGADCAKKLDNSQAKVNLALNGRTITDLTLLTSSKGRASPAHMLTRRQLPVFPRPGASIQSDRRTGLYVPAGRNHLEKILPQFKDVLVAAPGIGSRSSGNKFIHFRTHLLVSQDRV